MPSSYQNGSACIVLSRFITIRLLAAKALHSAPWHDEMLKPAFKLKKS
ncbi:hypothetical protein VRK_36180 [Vibrio sp. MEBiC08052]|nr:hypothetical protein VRK_36180 [Vibrio sp. MEBiC08052]